MKALGVCKQDTDNTHNLCFRRVMPLETTAQEAKWKETTHEAAAINQALTDDGLDESQSREVVKNGQMRKNSISRSNNFLKNELMKYYPIIIDHSEYHIS